VVTFRITGTVTRRNPVSFDLELHLQNFTVLLTAARFAILKRTALSMGHSPNGNFTPTGRSQNSG
jgi:hypothetical protein